LGSNGTILIAQYPQGAGSDECTAPMVAVTGLNVADNSLATTGCPGQSEALCARESGAAIENDIWFTWTAPATPVLGYTGYASVTTCALTTDDTKLAIYTGSGCPSGAALQCRDDTCGTGQTTLIIPVTAGATYTIQYGNSPGTPGGVSFIDIENILHPTLCDPWDDGTTELAVGALGPNDYGWMNRFGEPWSTTTITCAEIAYGSALPNRSLGVPAGTATELWVWQDGPTQDGDPSDAILLESLPINMVSVNTDILDTYPIVPVTVTGIFFVGTHCYNSTGIVPNVSGYTVPYDTTMHDWTETSWNFRADGLAAAVDPIDLTNNTNPVRSAESTGVFGQHLIRLCCTFGPTNTFCQPGINGAQLCPCTNPPSGLGRGCNNKDNTGGAILTSAGTPSLASCTLTLTDTNQNSTGTQGGILLSSKVTNTGINFGHGFRCIGAFKRLYNHVGAAFGSGGSVAFPQGGDLDMVAASAAKGDPIALGSARYFQVYYRDNVNFLPALTCSTSASKQNISQGEWCFWGP